MVLPKDPKYRRQLEDRKFSVNTLRYNIVLSFVDLAEDKDAIENVDAIIKVCYRHDMLRVDFGTPAVSKPVYIGILGDKSVKIVNTVR